MRRNLEMCGGLRHCRRRLLEARSVRRRMRRCPRLMHLRGLDRECRERLVWGSNATGVAVGFGTSVHPAINTDASSMTIRVAAAILPRLFSTRLNENPAVGNADLSQVLAFPTPTILRTGQRSCFSLNRVARACIYMVLIMPRRASAPAGLSWRIVRSFFTMSSSSAVSASMSLSLMPRSRARSKRAYRIAVYACQSFRIHASLPRCADECQPVRADVAEFVDIDAGGSRVVDQSDVGL